MQQQHSYTDLSDRESAVTNKFIATDVLNARSASADIAGTSSVRIGVLSQTW